MNSLKNQKNMCVILEISTFAVSEMFSLVTKPVREM